MPNPNSTTPYLSLTQVGQSQLSWDGWINSDLSLIDAFASYANASLSSLSSQQFQLNGSGQSVSLVAGANITLNSNASSITIVGPAPSGPSGNVIQGSNLATSTGTIVLSGSNVTISTGASSIQIIGPVVPAATNFSLNGTSSSVSLSAGAGIGIAAGASSLTISASVQTSLVSASASGNTTVSSTGAYSNSLVI